MADKSLGQVTYEAAHPALIKLRAWETLQRSKAAEFYEGIGQAVADHVRQEDAAKINGGKTGWPPGLLQDDSKGLSKWLATRPDARRIVRENVTSDTAHPGLALDSGEFIPASEIESPDYATVPLGYGIIDPDYARVFTQARIIAWQYGYSCVMHGSFTRDLDLLLVPWEATAKDNHDQILKLIASAGGLKFRDGKDVLEATVDWTEKSHGRKSTSLHFPGFNDRRWVDVSVIPTQPEQAVVVEPNLAGEIEKGLTMLLGKATELQKQAQRWRVEVQVARSDISVLMDVVFEGMEPGFAVEKVIERRRSKASLEAWKRARNEPTQPEPTVQGVEKP